jgi:ketosteroid isomerase-like protein
MSFGRFVSLAVAFGMMLGFAASPVAASPATAAMAPVHQFVDGFNRGDTKMEVAACTSPASVIDEFPPHVWQGPTACADWAAALKAASASAGYTDELVTLGKPSHVSVEGNRAYVVNPATFTYKVHGKPTSETGIWTFALRKTAAGWRITGWAWATTG